MAQAKPFFDEGGGIRGEKEEQGGAHKVREVVVFSFAPRNMADLHFFPKKYIFLQRFPLFAHYLNERHGKGGTNP